MDWRDSESLGKRADVAIQELDFGNGSIALSLATQSNSYYPNEIICQSSEPKKTEKMNSHECTNNKPIRAFVAKYKNNISSDFRNRHCRLLRCSLSRIGFTPAQPVPIFGIRDANKSALPLHPLEYYAIFGTGCPCCVHTASMTYAGGSGKFKL